MDTNNNQPIIMGSFDTSLKGPSNRKAWLILIVAGIVIAGIVSLLIFTLNKGGEGDSDSSTPISENVAHVNIEMTGVTPVTISVKKGQQITFKNNDTRPHRITADQTILGGFDSTEELTTGDSYTYVFETPGTYKYYDPSDPKAFNGTINVE